MKPINNDKVSEEYVEEFDEVLDSLKMAGFEPTPEEIENIRQVVEIGNKAAAYRNEYLAKIEQLKITHPKLEEKMKKAQTKK